VTSNDRNIKAVVFDLDGTLYPGTATVESYIKTVMENAGLSEFTEELSRETDAVLTGDHSQIPMGSFVRGLPGSASLEVVELDTTQPSVTIPVERDGEPPWDYLGDVWSVVVFLAQRHSIDRKFFIDAFHQSRFALSEGRLKFKPLLDLPRILNELRSAGIYLVMQTNSSDRSGAPTLQYLGLDRSFDEYIYDAEKPPGMERLFRRLSAELGVEAGQILSVGDHILNDVDASLRLGGQALLISPLPSLRSNGHYPRVHTLEELARFLRNLG